MLAAHGLGLIGNAMRTDVVGHGFLGVVDEKNARPHKVGRHDGVERTTGEAGLTGERDLQLQEPAECPYHQGNPNEIERDDQDDAKDEPDDGYEQAFKGVAQTGQKALGWRVLERLGEAGMVLSYPSE